MKHFSAVQRFYITLAVGFALIAGLFYALPRQLLQKTQAAASMMTRERQEIAIAETKLEIAKEQQDALNVAKPSLDIIRGYFVADSDAVHVLETLESMGRSAQLAVEMTVVDESPTARQFRVTTIGTYGEIADFLRQVESVKLYIRIMDMSIDNLAFSAGLDVLSPGSPGGSILALRSAGSDSKKTGMGAEKNLRVTFTVKVFRLPR